MFLPVGYGMRTICNRKHGIYVFTYFTGYILKMKDYTQPYMRFAMFEI